MKKKEVIKPKSDPITGKTLIIVAIILSVGATLVIIGQEYLKNKRVESERVFDIQQEDKRKIEISNCISNLNQEHTALWNSTCEKLDMEPDCLLPTQTGNALNKALQERKENCFRYQNK